MHSELGECGFDRGKQRLEIWRGVQRRDSVLQNQNVKCIGMKMWVCYTTEEENSSSQWATNWMGWIEILIVIENVMFYLFYIVCDAKESLQRQRNISL